MTIKTKDDKKSKMNQEESQLRVLSKAEKLYEDDKLLEAGRILKTLDVSILNDHHKIILDKAIKGQELVDDLTSTLDSTSHKSNDDIVSNPTSDDNSNPWIVHGVSKGEFPTLTAHRLEKGPHGTELKARCETPIDKSLLSPIISVLNETELYESWLPSWSVPKFKIQKCIKLSQRGRCSQVIIVTFEVPWPMANREVVLLADGIDDIDTNGDIAIRLHSLDTGDEKGLVPPPDNRAMRMDVDGGFLFRKCPKDHPALIESRDSSKGKKKNNIDDHNDDDDHDKILVTFAATMNPNLKLLPQSFLNFLVKVAFSISWNMLLKVARDVQSGKREDHKNKIKEKREVLYDWVESRIKDMMNFHTMMN